MRIFRAHPTAIEGIVEVNSALALGIEGEYWHKPSWIADNIENFHVMETNSWVYAAMSTFARDDFYEIETLAVHDGMRLQEAGTQLVDLAKMLAKREGFDELVVRSFKEHDAAGFYLKQGFSLSEKPFFCLGRYADEFRMDL